MVTGGLLRLVAYLALLAVGYGAAVAATRSFSTERSGWAVVASVTFILGIVLLGIFDVTSIRWFMWIIALLCGVSGAILAIERWRSHESDVGDGNCQPRRGVDGFER